MKPLYLDHAATTPLDPQVREAMMPFLDPTYGNPSSLHRWGREARLALDAARETTAAALNCDPAEICFTSGGTESCNLAIMGAALEARGKRTRLLISSVEHHCVLHAAEWLAPSGFLVEPLPVDSEGVVNLDAFRGALNEEVLLVSVMHGNNEIGSLQPVETIAALCREHGALFHTDAVQTFGSLPVDVEQIGCDLLSISAHKLYGPKAVGALYTRAGVKIKPLMVGGGQERDRRAGTENVAGIVGFAKAIQIAMDQREYESQRLKELRDDLIDQVLSQIPDSRLNGSRENRLPNNAHFCFEDAPADSLLIALDRAGIAASSGAACSAGSLEPSHVLLAIGLSEEQAQTGIRLTLGRSSDQACLQSAVEILCEQVARIRATRSPARPTTAGS